MKEFVWPLSIIFGWLLFVAGWITNVIWAFHQDRLIDVALGILGILVAPIGAIHGIYTWF